MHRLLPLSKLSNEQLEKRRRHLMAKRDKTRAKLRALNEEHSRRKTGR